MGYDQRGVLHDFLDHQDGAVEGIGCGDERDIEQYSGIRKKGG